ncbi:MAG: DNA-directed RNA polymerase subunit H [Nanoarchaeota archaeon]|nr:DNA-directed RNA polymerase subunit H [Nanoarchaeota archaeon]
MHALQPKHTKLKAEEVKKLLTDHNISLSQLPRIRVDDPAIPEGTMAGEVFKIERKEGDKVLIYYRVAVN